MDPGDLFYHFINDYNDRYPNTPIDVLDANGQPYGWVFYLKSELKEKITGLNEELENARSELDYNRQLMRSR